MPIPTHKQLRIPIMDLLSSNASLRMKEFVPMLAQRFNLTEDEVSQMYPTANGHIFYDRITWAVSYLYRAGIIDKPQRGVYTITDEGKRLLTTPEIVDKYIYENTKEEYVVQESKNNLLNGAEKTEIDTPRGIMQTAFQTILNEIYEEIIDAILGKHWRQFEYLVLDVLKAMGYGVDMKDGHRVTQATNDGGFDGIIKEDVLGFGKIYVQAKRYDRKNCVGGPELQAFAGALMGKSAKGVFITTSYFNKNAIDFVESLHGKINIVLIDGKQLAKFIYEYGIGMQTDQTYILKKLDNDFWESEYE